MKLIKNTERGWDLEPYFSYLREHRARFPAQALAFAEATWHYKFDDSRCPHDSWVDSLSIIEPATGDRQEIRRLEIIIKLLGAYHDGHIVLHYHGVSTYSLLYDRRQTQQGAAVAHDDWLIDEILLGDDGCVTHEIEFASGAVWNIRCSDIVYRWLPKE